MAPAWVASVALAASLWISSLFLPSLSVIRGRAMDPATKATILSLGLSEALNCTALCLLATPPVLLVAWWLDRRLRRSARPR